jgi:hypothetical protein
VKGTRRGRDGGAAYCFAQQRYAASDSEVNCPRMVQLYFQALFFEVTAENADQRCSILLLPQCGQAISFSCSEIVKIFEKVF